VAVLVHRSWALTARIDFYALVHGGFYDRARFFRVVRGFVVQFDCRPIQSASACFASHPDDPVRQPIDAGPSPLRARDRTPAPRSCSSTSRTTCGSTHSASRRLEGGGALGIVDSLYAQYGEHPSQDSIRLQGDAYLTRAYPNLDQIRTATIVREWR